MVIRPATSPLLPRRCPSLAHRVQIDDDPTLPTTSHVAKIPYAERSANADTGSTSVTNKGSLARVQAT